MENDEHFRRVFMFFDKYGSGYMEVDELRAALVDDFGGYIEVDELQTSLASDFGEMDVEVMNGIMREDTEKETIVCMAVAGAIFGAAIGGWMNDTFGRKLSILVAGVLFFVGLVVMGIVPAPWVIIVGRIIVGRRFQVPCSHVLH